MYYHTLAEMLIIKLVHVICKFFKRLGNSKSEQYYVCCFHSIPQQSNNMDELPHGDHIDKKEPSHLRVTDDSCCKSPN
jgi:hypothetical protein